MSENNLKASIAWVMERCAGERFVMADKIIAARRELREMFPDLQFDFDNNSFSDPALGTCNVKSISYLASTKRPYIKRFQKEERGKIGALVSRTYNATKEVMLRKGEAVDEIYTKMLVAIEERKKSQFSKLVKNVAGIYPHDKKHEFYISGEPIDLLQKSTGMPWELASCERYGGDHFEGVYSDISIGNLVCILQSSGGIIKYARVMLRWCLVNKKTPALGIEEIWYYAFPGSIGIAYRDSEDNEIAPGVIAIEATGAVEALLSKIGYMDYRDCVTPYRFGGFSDKGGHNTNITYTKRRV